MLTPPPREQNMDDLTTRLLEQLSKLCGVELEDLEVGEVLKSASCPIANTVAKCTDDVCYANQGGVSYTDKDGNQAEWQGSPELVLWIDAFDAGGYPEYERR